MKRILTLVLTAFILSGVTVSLLACGSDSDDTAAEQVVTVQRGDLTIDITAVGNLAFSHYEELTFGSEGTVGEVLVGIGDSVEEGQILAQLDDVSIVLLQRAVSQTRIDLENAEENLKKAEDPYTELDVAQAEAAAADAKVALEAAQEALEKAENPYTESDIVQAELAVINVEIALDKAENDLERAEERYESNTSVQEWEWDYEQKQKELAIAEFELIEAEETLAEMQAGADPLEVEQKQKGLAVSQADLKEAEDNLVEMLGDVDSLEVELRQSEVVSAQAALDEAIESLEMATMVAPFAGIVTLVNIEAGDAVNASQVIIELVDPDRFETEILVGETDILNIQRGAEATVQVDSVSGISFPANVTFISPTATIQQGVVNYSVGVEIEPLQAMMQEQQEVIPETMPDISSGELPEMLQSAVEEGRITQEQADEMMEQMQAGDISLPQRGGQLLTIISEDLQLREGMTVTVSIIVEQRNDVLLVPNSAITSSGRQTYVKVVLSDGTIEDRLVTTGISDWQYTEIVEGLNEGDSVVVPEGTTTTSTIQQNQPDTFFVPGMGGFGR